MMNLDLFPKDRRFNAGSNDKRSKTWEAISKKVEEANQARAADVAKFNRLKNEIKGSLESIYKAE